MNKKLIAAAVSAAIVAPVAAYGEVTVYGRINNAIDINDLSDAPGADSKTDLSSVSSRFGIKYSKEMGNGLTAHGKYEFATTTDRESKRAFVRADNNEKSDTTGVDDIRVATVGLSGPFGRIDAGNQWSSYFNTFGTLVSPTYTIGYYLYSSIGGAPYRSSNTIKYSNSFGPIYAELDVRVNDDGDEGSDVADKLRGDGIGLGLSWAINDNFTIAAAWDAEEGADGADAVAATLGTAASSNFAAAVPPTASNPGSAQVGTAGVAPTDAIPAQPDSTDIDRFGIGAKANFGGGYWLSVGWQNYEEEDDGDDIDTTFIWGGGNFSEKTNWLIGYAEADDDSSDADDPEQLTWGVYHNLGGGLKIYYEATDLDIEADEVDGVRHLIGMRVDF